MELKTSAPQSLPRTALPNELDRILRETSRSIYLTLKVAPRAIRRQLMLGYLFCRAADTLADTRALPVERRLEALHLYRAQFEADGPNSEAVSEIAASVETGTAVDSTRAPGYTPSEASLLRRLESCFQVYLDLEGQDQELLRRLLKTLTLGMEMDLRSFPSEESGELRALQTDQDLDRYCYHVAGCVGEFWTDLQAAHIPALRSLEISRMRDWGVRFGKGLQMTNVLRDLESDLLKGRCYLPRVRLEGAGVEPEALQRAVASGSASEDLVVRMRPVFDDLLDLTLEHYRTGWRYTLSLPRRIPRLRLACTWPLLIGLGTLALLRAGTRELLSGMTLRIPRFRVYSIVVSSSLGVFSNSALSKLYGRLEKGALRD